MIVNIDIQPAVAQRAGVGRYTRALAEHLSEWAGSDELLLSYFDFRHKTPPFFIPGARQRVIRWVPRRLAQYAWKKFSWPPYDWLAGRADVYHFPNYIRPPLAHGKSVVTVFDLSLLRFPETMESRNFRYLSAKLRDTIRRVDAVLTGSVFVANELCELMAVPREKVFPVLLGLTEHAKRPDAASVAAARRQLGLSRPYLLMVGTLEPRKNIPFLTEVFERLAEFDGDLVLAGMRGWKYKPIIECIRSSRCAERIRHLEYVNENDLPALYAGAELFVFPSLYEGFGFTPLEAMACGTPVVSSPAGSLREVLGDAAILVETSSADCWAETVRQVLDDSQLRSRLVSKGLEHARRFSWRETARKTWQVYRHVAGAKG